MRSRNILKVILTVFIAFVITGCSVKEIDFGKIIIEPKKKEFVYEREEVSSLLLKRVSEIAKAIDENKLNLINKKYIHPTFGLYNLSKIEGQNVFTHQKFIYNIVDGSTDEFSQSILRAKTYKYSLDLKLEEVEFKCSPLNDKYYGWDKEGLFLNDKTQTYLSSMMKETNKFEKDKYTKEDLHKAKMIETMSYKVVLTPEIIFYVNKVDDNWYITLLDRITRDCSVYKEKEIK